MTIRGFIFDLDGVLTDTSEYHYLAWQRLADEEGIPFNREENEALRGIGRGESLLRLLKGRPCSEARMHELMERKNSYYVALIRKVSPRDVLPGARELLQEIRRAGMKIGIGSSSKNTIEVIDRLGIGSLLDVIADGHCARQPKPAPDLFLHAAARLGLSPDECVVVEDAAAGIDAARAGGFHSVGLGPVERVGHADVLLPSLAGAALGDILAALESRLATAANSDN